MRSERFDADDEADAGSELELRDYLRVLRRRKFLVALVTLLVLAAALALSFLQAPVYQSTTEVLIQRSVSENVLSEQQQVPQLEQAALQTEIEVIRSRGIEDAVRKKLGYLPDVSVAAKGDTQVVTISAKDNDKVTAAKEANTYAQVYVEERRRYTNEDLLGAAKDLQVQLDRLDTATAALQSKVNDLNDQLATAPRDQSVAVTQQRDLAQSQLDQERAADSARRSTLTTQIDRLQLEATLNQSRGARIVSVARAPSSPISPKPVRDGAVGLVLGLLLGVGGAFLREYLDDTVRTREDLEAATGGLTTLGLIPIAEGWRDRSEAHIESIEHPDGSVAEAYRGVGTSLRFLGLDADLRTLHFTSAGAGEGKSTTASNVAVALARSGRSVLLVDCDLRRPRLDKFFGLDNTSGFTSVLLGEKRLEDCVVRISEVPRLAVLPSGPRPPAPSDLLSTRTAKEQLAALVKIADYIILDSPPLLPVTDSVILADYADAVVLVANAKTTAKRSLHRAVELLRQVDAPLAGTVFNSVPAAETYTYGGYGYDKK